MKAVLISIQPKWCELIASGKKTVEVRKSKPKLETPFKCYIYCTQGKGITDNYRLENNDLGNSKVIGEFVCDKIIKLNYSCGSYRCEGLDRVENDRIASASQLSLYDMKNYLTCKGGYAWHISDLVIYDKPKELSEFKRVCDGNCQSCQYAIWQTNGWAYEPYIVGCKPITRPPQSWCYVEERNER